jgi:hypothetical protein
LVAKSGAETICNAAIFMCASKAGSARCARLHPKGASFDMGWDEEGFRWAFILQARPKFDP